MSKKNLFDANPRKHHFTESHPTKLLISKNWAIEMKIMVWNSMLKQILVKWNVGNLEKKKFFKKKNYEKNK